MQYVDLFLAAVPTANKAAYSKHAEAMAVVFKDHGALSVVDVWGDDIPEGETNSFHTAVMRKDDETIASGWVVWPDKATRDKGMESMMSDARMQEEDMPFDGKRLIFGGFEKIIDL
ncbi:MAG: DUF1428 domain-containing protein [Alphaproteobacteria bacterium]|nr:DUF1428 domain-containing protein [Alphaproteobacteria bacterium]